MTTTLDDLKAPIIVIFKQIVANKIKMGDKGRALFLYQNSDLDDSYQLDSYKSAIITLTDTTLEAYIKQLFRGGCKQVHVLQYKTNISSVTTVMDDLLPNFDWVMSVDSSAQTDIIAYAKAKERFCMTYNNQADSIYVCSHQNTSVVYVNDAGTETTLTGLQFIPIIGGVACGCPYDRSITSKIFTELKSVEQPSTYNLGQLTLYPEEEGIRLANACNTLQTTSANLTEDMKSLCIAEGMQRIKLDLIKGFRLGYKGKYKNTYDNQNLFYSAVKYGYIKELENVGILDPNYANTIYTDVTAQRNAWLAIGKQEAEDWDEETVCKMTYKNMIYAILDVKLVDAMEGMQLTVEMF